MRRFTSAPRCIHIRTPSVPRYKARFHSVSLTSNTGNNIFYSFNKGLTHFVVFSAEAYLYSRDAAFLANQLAFMSSDLAAVDRSVTPWVVALVHKGAWVCVVAPELRLE